MEPSLFADVEDAVRGLLPLELDPVYVRSHRYGIKVWFGSAKPTREHYEAQVVGAKDVPDAKVLAIEVGFHAEHTKEKDNEEVLTHLLACEKRWRRSVGNEPTAGVFLGRAEHWRRVSETWADPDLSDADLAFEIAARLTDYVTALEPALRSRANT